MSVRARRGSAIMTTLFLMFGMTVMAIIAIDIITNGLQRRRAEGASLKAFYAAEAGVEQAALRFRLAGHQWNDCRSENSLYFQLTQNPIDCSEQFSAAYLFGNENLPQYSVKVKVGAKPLTNQLTFNSRGSFQGTNRELEVYFCLPDCSNGGNDGCGGSCQ